MAHQTEEGTETTSWGHAELALLGSAPSRVLRSTWSYPTGGELKQEKFAGAGPWKDVDWSMLRRKTTAAMQPINGSLGAVAPVDLRDTLTLPLAATSARARSRVLMGKWFFSEAALPD